MSNNDISRLTEMAVRGKEYREPVEYEYFGEELELGIGALEDEVLIPVTGTLQSNFGMDDIEDASEEIEDSRDESGDIDPSKLDKDFVRLMGRVCVEGIDRDMADAEGTGKEQLEKNFGVHEDAGENIGFRRGLTLEISQDILDISADAESAEKFRR